jgi:hypothetical protein
LFDKATSAVRLIADTAYGSRLGAALGRDDNALVGCVPTLTPISLPP